MSKDEKFTDAHFEVVSGPLRVGDEHPTRKDWFFTGQYNADGDPYFVRGQAWWDRVFRKHERRAAWRRRSLKAMTALGYVVLPFIVAYWAYRAWVWAMSMLAQ